MAENFIIVFALYPRVTQLDFTGPYEVFWRLPGAECVLASVSGGDLEADGGITLAPLKRWRMKNSLRRSGALLRARAMLRPFALAPLC